MNFTSEKEAEEIKYKGNLFCYDKIVERALEELYFLLIKSYSDNEKEQFSKIVKYIQKLEETIYGYTE